MSEILDYGPEIIDFLKRNFIPARPGEKDVMAMSLSQIYGLILDVLPSDAITQMDVYEALKELGYNSFAIVEKSKKKGSKPVTRYKYLLKKK